MIYRKGRSKWLHWQSLPQSSFVEIRVSFHFSVVGCFQVSFLHSKVNKYVTFDMKETNNWPSTSSRLGCIGTGMGLSNTSLSSKNFNFPVFFCFALDFLKVLPLKDCLVGSGMMWSETLVSQLTADCTSLRGPVLSEHWLWKNKSIVSLGFSGPLGTLGDKDSFDVRVPSRVVSVTKSRIFLGGTGLSLNRPSGKRSERKKPCNPKVFLEMNQGSF